MCKCSGSCLHFVFLASGDADLTTHRDYFQSMLEINEDLLAMAGIRLNGHHTPKGINAITTMMHEEPPLVWTVNEVVFA